MNVFVVIKFKLLLYFNNNKRPVLVCYYSNNKHNNPYIGACRLEQVVICAQYLEFRAAVDLVGDLLLLGGQLLDELLCQHVTLFQEVVLFGHALVDRFRDALAIAFGLQAVHGDATGDQVIDDRLRPSLRQSLVVFVGAFAVGMRTQLDRHVRVVVEHLDHLVECLFRFGAQGCLIEVVEDVFHYNRFIDGREEEIDDVGLVFLLRVGLQLEALVQVAPGAGHHHVADVALQLHLVEAILLHERLLVQSVATDDPDRRVLDRVFVDIVDVALDLDRDGRQFEGIDMVVAPGVVAVRAEEALLAAALEGDPEVVAHRVDRRAQVADVPVAGAVEFRHEKVESAHAGVAVRREIERHGVAHVGEHLVARSVDLFAQVFHRSEGVAVQPAAEDVLSAKAAHDVGDEIEVSPVR